MEVTFIHLSDLHFKKDAESKRRVEHLLDDLDKQQISKPAWIMFTGDLVNAGDEYECLYEDLFDELIEPVAKSGYELAIVPGNHDIQRSVASCDFANNCLNNSEGEYLFKKNEKNGSPYGHEDKDPLKHYRVLEGICSADHRSYWGYTQTKGSVSVIGLNSAWLSCDRDDRGKLRIESYALNDWIRDLPRDTLKVALFHHPLDWLDEASGKQVNHFLTEHIDLALYGHRHESDCVDLSRGDSSCMFVQSLPLRADGSSGANGYGIIRCDTDHKTFEITYRSYSSTRNKFITGSEFGENGICYPRRKDKEFFANRPQAQGLIKKFLEKKPNDFDAWYQDNIDMKIKNSPEGFLQHIKTLVMPKAHRVSNNLDDRGLEIPTPIGTIISESDRNQFFMAPPDAGLTTAACLVFKKLVESVADHQKVPAFFDASKSAINRQYILRAIRQSSMVDCNSSEAQQAAENGTVVLVVDGLSLADFEQFNKFQSTLKQYFPKIRVICFLTTAKRGFSTTSEDDLDLSKDDGELYEFSEFSVSDIRAMVERQLPEKVPDARENIVTHVVESFQQMAEPIFPSSVAIVIQTLRHDPEFRPLNRSRLLERYVECLLGRYTLVDVQEGTFASSDKIDLLSFFARKLHESQDRAFDDNKWQDGCNEYQAKYSLDLPEGLQDEFMQKGLFTAYNNGKMTFRSDDLFSFFVARRMKSDSDFLDQLLSSDGLFKYRREIVFYGHLEGTDVHAVLDKVHNAAGEVQKNLLDIYKNRDIDLQEEWNKTCQENAKVSNKKDVKKAKKDLRDTQPNPEYADRESNHQLSQVHRQRGIAIRRSVTEAEAKMLVLMDMYALLLKNALQLPANDKLRHLKKLYQVAETWVGFLCAKREELSCRQFVFTGGIWFTNYNFNPDDPNQMQKLLRNFRFIAPNSLSRRLAQSLNNPQLSKALREVLPDLSPMGSLFARDVLLEMPGNDNVDSYVASLSKENNTNLITSSLRTARLKYLVSSQHKHVGLVVKKVLKKTKFSKPSTFNLQDLKREKLMREWKSNNQIIKRERDRDGV